MTYALVVSCGDNSVEVSNYNSIKHAVSDASAIRRGNMPANLFEQIGGLQFEVWVMEIRSARVVYRKSSIDERWLRMRYERSKLSCRV